MNSSRSIQSLRMSIAGHLSWRDESIFPKDIDCPYNEPTQLETEAWNPFCCFIDPYTHIPVESHLSNPSWFPLRSVYIGGKQTLAHWKMKHALCLSILYYYCTRTLQLDSVVVGRTMYVFIIAWSTERTVKFRKSFDYQNQTNAILKSG